MSGSKRSTLATILAAAGLLGAGCDRPGHRVTASDPLQGMSKEAADLARKETMLSLEAQEQLRRERDTVMPRHAPEREVPAPEREVPPPEPEHGVPVALNAQR